MSRVEKWHITADGQGMGGAFAPPGHPDHTYVVWEGYFKSMSKARCLMSVSGAAAGDSYVPPDIRRRARNLLDRAQLKHSVLWVKHVYGYFRGMYLPDSGSRNVSDLINDPGNTIDPQRHAAAAHIRQWFPHHDPLAYMDLISPAPERKLYGSYPCVRCGARVQYEPRHDALAEFGKIFTPCGNVTGRRHMWELRMCSVGSATDRPCGNIVEDPEHSMCGDCSFRTGPIGD